MHNQFIRHIYKFSCEKITTLSSPTLDNPLTQYEWTPVKKSPIYYLQTLLWKLMRRHTHSVSFLEDLRTQGLTGKSSYPQMYTDTTNTVRYEAWTTLCAKWCNAQFSKTTTTRRGNLFSEADNWETSPDLEQLLTHSLKNNKWNAAQHMELWVMNPIKLNIIIHIHSLPSHRTDGRFTADKVELNTRPDATNHSQRTAGNILI